MRIPYADTSLHRVPQEISNTQRATLSDMLPTGFEIGVHSGYVQPGETVAVVGAGPIGLSVILTSSLYGAAQVFALDLEETRLELARSFGATQVMLASSEDRQRAVLDLTDGRGADVSVGAVGIPETFQMAVDSVRSGGHVANVGVHGKPVPLHLEDLWFQNLTITTRLVNANTTPVLLRLVTGGRLPAEQFATHEFAFAEFMDAYDTFSKSPETGALKVNLTK